MNRISALWVKKPFKFKKQKFLNISRLLPTLVDKGWKKYTNQVCTDRGLMASQCKGNDITKTNFLNQVKAIYSLWSPSWSISGYSYLLQTG